MHSHNFAAALAAAFVTLSPMANAAPEDFGSLSSTASGATRPVAGVIG